MGPMVAQGPRARQPFPWTSDSATISGPQTRFPGSRRTVRALLVNPWIADVAAYNFWLRPLGLYRLAEWLAERGVTPLLLDCLSPAAAPGPFSRSPVPTPAPLRPLRRRFARYGISEDVLKTRLEAFEPFDAVLVTSALSYWYPGVVWAIREIRRKHAKIPVYLGGLYPTLWPEHAAAHSGADGVFPGPLENHGERLTGLLSLPQAPVREFRPWHELGLHDGATYAALRTSVGCPFRCSYCASERVSGPYRRRPPAEVVDELRALALLGVTDVAFYDDALLLGFDEHLGPILDGVEDLRLPLRFHTPNGLHTRAVTTRLARRLARSRFETVRLSLETVDSARQGATGRKVDAEDVRGAVRALIDAGIPRQALGVYLLMGLPQQPLEEVQDSIDFVRSLGVRPYVSEFSPIPGTPEWAHLIAAGAIPDDLDPLLTNNSVFYRLFSGYPEAHTAAMLRLSRRPLPSTQSGEFS